MIWKNNPVNKTLIPVGANKLFGTIFHGSPEGVKHRDVQNNSFAQRWLHIAMPRANEFAPSKNED